MKALARAGGGEGSYKGGTGEMSTVYDATQGWGTMRLRYMGRCVDTTRDDCLRKSIALIDCNKQLASDCVDITRRLQYQADYCKVLQVLIVLRVIALRHTQQEW